MYFLFLPVIRLRGKTKVRTFFISPPYSSVLTTFSSEDLKALFDLYDINHNNEISWKEYVCTVVLIMNGTSDEKLTLLFNAFDENRDQKITLEEFSEAVGKFSKSEAENKTFVHTVFQQCDINGDGIVTFAEFKKFLQTDKTSFSRVVGILGVGLGTN